MEPIMADHTKLPYLRLVTSPPAGRRTPKLKTQLDLFMDREPNVLGLFWLAPARMRLFAKAIDSTRPRYVFDLRVLPSFDGAGITRRSMFRLMEASGCTYIDAMGRIGGTDRRNALLESGAFEECVRSVCGTDLVGPIFFLFQSREDLSWSSSVLPKVLQPAPRKGWRVHVLGGDPSEAIDAFTDTVQSCAVGEILYVVASPSESTGWLLDDRGRPTEPVNLPRGSSVRVAKLQVGQWIDVVVLGGPHRGCNVRLALNAHIVRLVK
jgi:hypothetical protein